MPSVVPHRVLLVSSGWQGPSAGFEVAAEFRMGQSGFTRPARIRRALVGIMMGINSRGAANRSVTGVLCTGALLVQLLACSVGRGDGEWGGTVTDSSGIVIVANPERGMWTEQEAWILEEDLRIGTFGGDLHYQFGQVGAVAVDSRGEIYVSDRQAQEVRVFSATGSFLRTVGTPGSGPGELGLGASELLISPGDTLLVPDPRNRRINRYAPDGASLGSVPLDPERERPLRFKMNSLGAMTVQLRPVRVPSQQGVEARDAIRVIETTGQFGDTLLEVPSGGLFDGPGIHYFTPEPMWDMTDSLTVLYGVNSEYRIGSYDRDRPPSAIGTSGLSSHTSTEPG
jgi:hypothetical protein